MKVVMVLASWLLAFPLHAGRGDLDPLDLNIASANSVVDATAVQPDGKVVRAGYSARCWMCCGKTFAAP